MPGALLHAGWRHSVGIWLAGCRAWSLPIALGQPTHQPEFVVQEGGMLSEQQYLERASSELQRLMTALDELEDELEAELANDILTIEFEDGSKFVVNSHRAARQIWMAAGRSAWHFDYAVDAGEWRASKQDEELWASLSAQLSQKLGRKVVLSQ